MAAVTFTNPADGTTYVWPTNPDYSAESQGGTQYQSKARNIERTSNTGNVGATRQQGDDGPFIIHWQVTVLYAALEDALWKWYQICNTQSIYLTDFDGQMYEGQIITVERARQGVAAGPGDTTRLGYYGVFVFEFEVWKFLPAINASVTGGPVLPVTVVEGINDRFNYVTVDSPSAPLDFTIAPGTYDTIAELAAAANAARHPATGSEFDRFDLFVTVTSIGATLVFTSLAPGTAGNHDTITEGDGGAATLGLSTPATLTGGTRAPLAGVNT